MSLCIANFCLGRLGNLSIIRVWLAEIQQSDWSFAMIKNLTDHAKESHVLQIKDNGFIHGRLSFKHLEVF